jgi:peptidoglycan/xylan/chitin deacetylase (PgdA/CDA1 family)
MADHGIAFGSHTLTHPILSQLPLPEVEREILASKRLIEARLHRPVRLFAYPNGKPGDYSAAIIDVVKRAGYEAALTAIAGANAHGEDLYRLKRIKPHWRQELPAFAFGMTYYLLAGSRA